MSVDAAAPPAAPTTAAALFQILTGHYVSSAVNVAAGIGLADAFGDNRRSYAELAEATKTHPASLLRLLRLLTTAGIVRERDAGVFELTDLGRHLRTDVSDSLHAVALLHAGRGHQQRLFDLADRVRTGPPADEGPAHSNPFAQMPPHVLAIFQKAMTFFASHTSAAVLAAYDFGRFRTLVDVGGGEGSLLSAILRATPTLRGIVYDLPALGEAAAEQLRAEGVSDRAEVVGGDFFEKVPAGADAYLLKNVVHDWDDERAVTVLTRCREAMADGGVVLLVESLLPERFDDSFVSRLAAISDVSMLLGGGQERTAEQMSAVCAAAGLRVNRVVPIVPSWTGVASTAIIEATAA